MANRPHVIWIHSQPEPYLNRMIDELARRSDFSYEAVFLRRNPGEMEQPLPAVAGARFLSVEGGEGSEPRHPFLTTHPDWRREIFGDSPPSKPSRSSPPATISAPPISHSPDAVRPPSAIIMAGYRSRTLRHVLRECRARDIPVAIFADSNLRGERGRSLSARLKRAAKRWALRSIIRDIDTLFVANRLGAAYWRYYGAPAGKIVTCPYYADYPRVEAALAMPRAEALAPFQLEQTPRLIVTAARLVPVKGLELMMRAFRAGEFAGQGEGGGWTWAIAGTGPLEDMLKREAGPELGKSIRLLGFVQPSQLLPLIRHADLFVLPSLQEPHGIVVQEALAAGTPVIASHTCGAAFDLVRTGVNGWIFRSGQADDLLAKLRAATANPAKLAAMRAVARQSFESWFAQNNPVKIIDHWAHEVIGRVRPSVRRDDQSGMKRRLLFFFKLAIFAVVLALVGRQIAGQWNLVRQTPLRLDWSFAPAAVAGFVGVFGTSGLVWWWMARRMGDRHSPPRLLGAYVFSQIGKYVPGKIVLLLMRLERTARAGMDPQICVLSTLLENLFYMISGALVAGITSVVFVRAPLAAFARAHPIYLTLLALCVIPLAGVIRPRIFYRLVNLGLKQFGQPPVDAAHQLGWPLLALSLLLFVPCWLFGGVALWACLRGVGITADAIPILVLPGTFAASVIGGMAIGVAPGGLGPREAIQVSLLTAVMPQQNPGAIILAVGLQRLAQVVAEVVLMLVGAGLTARRQPRIE